eukprot:jgi/Bigna1/75499/fgenesh1_pg.35_\
MCRFGEQCRFKHDAEDLASSEERIPPSSRGDSESKRKKKKQPKKKEDLPKCCICYEHPPSKVSHPESYNSSIHANLSKIFPQGRRYGLLSGCDHVFCLECIRQWRRTATQKKEVVRKCPMCRQTSYYVVPAHRHDTGEDKRKTIERFKSSTSMIPCRYQSQGRACPFGHRCFYLHLDENGVDTKPDEEKEWEKQQLKRERRAARARRHVELVENLLRLSIEGAAELGGNHRIGEGGELRGDELISTVLLARDLLGDLNQ